MYFKQFCKYTSLNILGMLGLSCYILADTFFVSRALGANGLTALNIAIPVYNFINGSGLMIGIGGGIIYTIFISQNNHHLANTLFSLAFYLTIFLGIVFSLTGLLFSNKLVTILGANSEVHQMANTYLKIIMMFAPMFMMNNLFLSFVRNDGNPALAMIAMLGGSLSNVILDYILIFPFKMGILGAVLATGLAPITSMMILATYLLKKKNHFHLIKVNPFNYYVINIITSGLPSLISEGSAGMVMIIFNLLLKRIGGNVAIAAYGIIANISLVVIAIYTGITQGIQPLLSDGYGKNDFTKIKTIYHYALSLVIIISIVVYSLILFNSETITNLFNSQNNHDLYLLANKGLKIYFSGCIFAGINLITAIYFSSINKNLPAQIISLLRGLFLMIPMAYILAYLLHLDGIYATFPIVELIVSILAISLYIKTKNIYR